MTAPNDRFFFYALVIATYVLAQGATIYIIAPAQRALFSQFAYFGCLIYLPQGVRVLSTMYFGWRSIAPLAIGSLIGRFIFSADAVWTAAEPLFIASTLVGGTSAFLAFEIFRAFGKNCYASIDRVTHWRQVMLVGSLAAVLNGTGLGFLFFDQIPADDWLTIQLVSVFGSIFGLLVTLLTLMLIFRWVRIANHASKF